MSKKNLREVIKGLEKIAVGKTNDSISLIFTKEPITAEKISSLDLFQISEIKRDKDGGVQIKFFDRKEALESLYNIALEEQNSAVAGEFITKLSGGK